jgi:hypothetical protein
MVGAWNMSKKVDRIRKEILDAWKKRGLINGR